MTTEVAARNPFAERHQLREDLRAARVARDTIRGQTDQLAKEKQQAEGDAFKFEMEALLGTEGGAERRDAALERVRGAEKAEPQYRRSFQAAEELIKIRETQLEQLYDDPECYDAFVAEADAATAGAVRDLRELLAVLGRANKSWAKAAALWRPMYKPLRTRLEALNEQEGAYPNTASQAAVPPFPFSLPSGLGSAAPRPPGIERLRLAQARVIQRTGVRDSLSRIAG